MTMNTPMLVTFLVYILGMILIGLIAYRATNNFDDSPRYPRVLPI